jgi:hypothetical protein
VGSSISTTLAESDVLRVCSTQKLGLTNHLEPPSKPQTLLWCCQLNLKNNGWLLYWWKNWLNYCGLCNKLIETSVNTLLQGMHPC